MGSLTFWLAVGFTGQLIFTARFLIQWAASERCKRTVVPRVFWWLSLLGGELMLAYAIYRRDPVIIFGQTFGIVVYTRNLMLSAKPQVMDSRSGALVSGPIDDLRNAA